MSRSGGSLAPCSSGVECYSSSRHQNFYALRRRSLISTEYGPIRLVDRGKCGANEATAIQDRHPLLSVMITSRVGAPAGYGA